MIETVPRTVVFACRWTIGDETKTIGGAKLIPVICSGRVSPGFVLQALEWGAGGVMVAGCGPEKCRYMFGAKQQEGQFEILREWGRLLGLEPERLKLVWVEGPEQLEEEAAAFTETVKKLGPLPVTVRAGEKDPVPPIKELREISRSFACIDCGKCTGFCPVSRHTKGYSPHRVVARSLFDDVPEKKLADAVWGCLTCGLCERRCPAGVRYANLQQGLRVRARAEGDTGRCTHGGALLTMMRLHANSKLPQDRLSWIPDDLKVAKKGEVGLFVGCAPYFDEMFAHMNVKTLDATKGAIRLLNEMGIEPVVMDDEVCCGHDLLWSGDRTNFERLAKANVENLKARGIKKLVHVCAECYRTAEKDWPEVTGATPFKNVHIAEVVAESKLKLTGEGVHGTIQDPCRLSRHLGKADAIRGALSKASSVEVTEMDRSGVAGSCCGSSSWLNCTQGTAALQADRLAEAKETGADVLLTACPKCEVHLACAQFGKDDPIRIENIASVLAGAIQEAPSTAPEKSEAKG